MAKKQPQTQLPAKWDEELARQAAAAAKMEQNTGGGQFFSLKSGVLSWQDTPMPNNQMAVVILDHVLENVFFEEEFDPDAIQSPTCFAFGRDESTIAPHPMVVERKDQQCGMSGLCQGCPQNEFGTADKGRGKACRNCRRLGLVPAGELDAQGKLKLIDDVEHYQSTAVGFLRVPPTSIRGFASFVKQVAGALKRPPCGIVTKIRVVPDPKCQFRVLFEPMMNVPDQLLGAIMKRREEVAATIDFPYAPIDEAAAPRDKEQGRGKDQKGRGKGKTGRRY